MPLPISYYRILKYLYPNVVGGVNGNTHLILDNSNNPLSVVWSFQDPPPTIAELETEWVNVEPIIMNEIRTTIEKNLEDAILDISKVITKYDVNPVVMAEWQLKESTWKQWVIDGKPAPDIGNDYEWVLDEAQEYIEAGDVLTASDLLELWGQQAIAWRVLNRKVFPTFRKHHKNIIKDATYEQLITFTKLYYIKLLIILLKQLGVL